MLTHQTFSFLGDIDTFVTDDVETPYVATNAVLDKALLGLSIFEFLDDVRVGVLVKSQRDFSPFLLLRVVCNIVFAYHGKHLLDVMIIL